MTTFIFSESAEAVALRDTLKGQGEKAFIRNASLFNPSDFDASCDVVYTDSEAIADAFAAKGRLVSAFPWTPGIGAGEPEAPAPKEAPKAKAKAKAKVRT